jgi:hypothetical protein
MALDLVGRGCDARAIDEGLQVLLGVVGNTDSARLLLRQFGHGLPRVDDGDIIEHLDVAVVRQGEEVVVDILLLVKSDGEVDLKIAGTKSVSVSFNDYTQFLTR